MNLAAGLPGSDQAQRAEARMALATDNQVIVNGDPQRLGEGHNFVRHLDIRA